MATYQDPQFVQGLSTKSSEADLDQTNQWLRMQPWYADFLQQRQAPGGGVRLSDQDQATLEQLIASRTGLNTQLDIDPSGNIDKPGHKLRNVLLGAGIGAGAAFGAPALLGALGAGGGGAAASGAGLAGAGAGAGVLPSAVIGSGMMPGIAGGVGLGAGAGAGAGIATGGSILGKLGGMLGGKSGMLGAIGKGIGDATSAAGNTRRADIDTNVGAQSAYNSGLMQRAGLEQQQRHQALADIYRQNAAVNPSRSPFNIAPRPTTTPGMQQALSGLEQQALTRLQQAPEYATTGMAPLEQFRSKPGMLERIGGYAGPIASIGGVLMDQRRPR